MLWKLILIELMSNYASCYLTGSQLITNKTIINTFKEK